MAVDDELGRLACLGQVDGPHPAGRADLGVRDGTRPRQGRHPRRVEPGERRVSDRDPAAAARAERAEVAVAHPAVGGDPARARERADLQRDPPTRAAAARSGALVPSRVAIGEDRAVDLSRSGRDPDEAAPLAPRAAVARTPRPDVLGVVEVAIDGIEVRLAVRAESAVAPARSERHRGRGDTGRGGILGVAEARDVDLRRGVDVDVVADGQVELRRAGIRRGRVGRDRAADQLNVGEGVRAVDRRRAAVDDQGGPVERVGARRDADPGPEQVGDVGIRRFAGGAVMILVEPLAVGGLDGRADRQPIGVARGLSREVDRIVIGGDLCHGTGSDRCPAWPRHRDGRQGEPAVEDRSVEPDVKRVEWVIDAPRRQNSDDRQPARHQLASLQHVEIGASRSEDGATAGAWSGRHAGASSDPRGESIEEASVL